MVRSITDKEEKFLRTVENRAIWQTEDQKKSLQSSQPSPLVLDPESEDRPSRIDMAIRKGIIPRMRQRARSYVRLRPAPQESAHKSATHIKPPKPLEVFGISAITFDHLARQKDHEIFNISIREIDSFLGIEASPSPSIPSSRSTAVNLKVHLQAFPPLNPGASLSEKEIHLAISTMSRELTLETSVTQEELEAYRRQKDVDPATLLPPQYHDWSDVMSGIGHIN